MDITLGSLFDGIGGFPREAERCGIRTDFTAEIEPFPVAVTVSRFPNARHLLDVSQIRGCDVRCDVLTFGSPCQDVSVAGKQKGMKHEGQGDEETTRSGLFFEAVRIIKEMRLFSHGQYPRFAVWENVPGAFSSDKGRDFLGVLEALASIAQPGISIPEPKADRTGRLQWATAGAIVGDGFSIAWRVHDAQYRGVPQRRARIYLIADFASERAAEILFERYCVSGDPSPRVETREETPADALGRVDRGVGDFDGADHTDGIGRTFGIVTKGNGEAFLSEEKHTTLTSGGGQAGQGYPAILSTANTLDGIGRGVDCLNPWDSQTMRVYSVDGIHPAVSANAGGGQDRHGVVYPDVARALTASYDSSPCDDRGQNVVVEPALFMAGQGAKAGSIAYSDSVSPTLKGCASGLNQTPSVVALQQNASGEVRASDVAYTLNTNGNATGRNSPVIALQANGIDRALTAGCNGSGWRENEMYTLNTIDRHAVVFENHAQDSRITECGDVAPVVSAKYGTGGNNTPIVCEPQETYQKQVGALCATDYKWVQQQQVGDGKLIVTPTKQDPPARRYIVRRLTPTECLRLQGYPDDWCDITPAIERAGEQMLFWNEVRSTVAKITGKAAPRALASADAARAYVSKLKTDATIYKAAGNSLAEPCARQVLYRIMTIGFGVCPHCKVRLTAIGNCVFCGRKYEL